MDTIYEAYKKVDEDLKSTVKKGFKATRVASMKAGIELLMRKKDKLVDAGAPPARIKSINRTIARSREKLKRAQAA